MSVWQENMVTRFVVLSICSSAVCISPYHSMLVYASAACNMYVYIYIHTHTRVVWWLSLHSCSFSPKFYAEVYDCMLANTDCVWSEPTSLPVGVPCPHCVGAHVWARRKCTHPDRYICLQVHVMNFAQSRVHGLSTGTPLRPNAPVQMQGPGLRGLSSTVACGSLLSSGCVRCGVHHTSSRWG